MENPIRTLLKTFDTECLFSYLEVLWPDSILIDFLVHPKGYLCNNEREKYYLSNKESNLESINPHILWN